jgi:hypothetical protein
MIFKHQQHRLMAGKPVVIFNRCNSAGVRFWDPLIGLLESMCRPGDFVVAETLEEILPAIAPEMKRKSSTFAELIASQGEELAA